MDLVHGHARLQRLEDRKDAAVVDLVQAVGKRRGGERFCVQRIEPDLRAAHRLEERRLKGGCDRHDLTGRLHLRAELAGCARELVKRPLRKLDDHIVERGLKAGAGLARDVVADLVKREPERDLGGDLGDRIAGCLGGERRGTRHTRVDLDDRIVKAVRIEGKLAVAPADDAERRNDVERRRAEHLIFLVREGQRGRHDDGIAGVDADGIDIFHRADGDDVAACVAHGLKLDLFPAVDILLYEDLRDRRGVKPTARDGAQLVRAVSDAAARAAEREGGADDDGIADAVGNGKRGVRVARDVRGNDRLADRLHRVLEELSVLGAVDGVHICADEAHTVRVEKPGFIELHREGQTRLPAEPGKQTVRLFLLDDAHERLLGQRFEVDLVRECTVGHDGCGVGVDEDDVDACVPQDAARLCTRVVKLRRLPDDDRTRADHEDFFDAFVNRHGSSLLSSDRRSGQTEMRYRAVRRTPRGGTAPRRREARDSRCPRRCRRWR